MYSSVFLGARLRSGNTSKVLILSHPRTPIRALRLRKRGRLLRFIFTCLISLAVSMGRETNLIRRKKNRLYSYRSSDGRS